MIFDWFAKCSVTHLEGDNCLRSIPLFSEYQERDLESQRLDGIADLLEL